MNLKQLFTTTLTVASLLLALQGHLVQAADPVAYVSNAGSSTVSTFNVTTNAFFGLPISVGNSPFGLAFTPDGSKVYVVNNGDSSVSIINTADRSVSPTTISTDNRPFDIAIGSTINGNYAYVTNFDNALVNSVTVINTDTDTLVTTIDVNSQTVNPIAIAITPNGEKVYVVGDNTLGHICVINANNNTLMTGPGYPISPGGLGAFPQGIAITPLGDEAYVTLSGSNSVVVINTSTDTISDTINQAGFFTQPSKIAIGQTTNGLYAYVTNGDTTITVIDTFDNSFVISIAPGQTAPTGLALTPDNSEVIVANSAITGTISIINANNNTVASGSPQPTGGNSPRHVAITPASTLTPVITSISPNSGPTTGGTSVTITGNYFTGTTAVNFGSTPASSFTLLSSTTIIATTPPT